MVYTIRSEVLEINNENDKERVWKQLVLSFLASIPFITHGVETIVLSASAHSGHFMITPESVPWTTTAMILGAGISAPIYAYLIDRFGRRLGLFVISLIQGASCIPLFLGGSEVNLIILHTFAGISAGGLFTVLPIYIREISNDSIRGLTISLMVVMTSAGYMTKLLMTDEVMMYLMVALIAIQLILIVILMESPSYLIKIGDIETAKTNITKLKCLPKDSQLVTKTLSHLKEEKERATVNGNLTVIGIMKNTIYRDATKIGIVLNTAMVLCGSIVFLDQDKSLLQLKTDLDPERALIVACLFSGSLFLVALIKFIERKYLLTFAFVLMILSMGILAIYTQNDLTVREYRIVPIITLGATVFAYGVAWGLPTIIMVEILNLEIRARITGILFLYSQIIKLLHVHTFKYIEDSIGIYTVLYIFVGVNIFGGVYTLFAVPNLKNMNVKQIERQLKRIPLLQFTYVKNSK